MSLQVGVSLIYFLAFIIYVFFSIFILMLNHKARIYRVFFLIPFFMAIWAFSISIANAAPSYEVALTWNRISSVGWGAVYSCILHFMIVLYQIENGKKTYKGRLFFLYIPALFIVLIFGVIERTASMQFNLVYTRFGWTNIYDNNSIDMIYNGYYSIFIIIVLIMLIQRGLNAKTKQIKIQSVILIGTFLFAFIIGTITDVLIGIIYKVPSIQTGPIIIIIPVFAFYIVIKKYGFIHLDAVSSRSFEGDILTVKTRIKILQYLALIFTLGSLLSFAYQFYLHNTSVNAAMLHNGGFLLFGFVLYGLQKINVSEKFKDIILMIILTTTIPYVILYYATYDGSITIWSLPFVFIILSVLFSQKILLSLLMLSSVLTMVIVFLITPTKAILLQREDHFLRIFFLIIAIGLAKFVQKVYIQRLKENEQQLHYQRLLASLSKDILVVSKANFIEKIQDMFTKIGRYVTSDRVYFIESKKEGKGFVYAYEWLESGVKSTNKFHDMNRKVNFDWIHSQFQQLDYVNIQDSNELPIDAHTEKKFMQVQEAMSQLFIPLRIHNEIIGMLGFDFLSKKHQFSLEDIKQYQVFANILSDLFQKTESEEEINFLAYYDSLTKLPNRTLLRKHIENAIQESMIEESHFAVLFIDLDTFKLVNDTIGHSGGDELLKEVAQKIKNSIREQDLLSRFSGDEFVVLVKGGLSVEEVEYLCERILNSLRCKIHIDHNEFTITSSIGISIFPELGESVDELIKNADFAMYEAKLAGKNQFKICTQSMLEKITRRNRLSIHLQRAIEKNEFTVFYQPQVNVMSEEIIGFEALLRWNNSEFGFVPPSVFIPIAEQSGLIKSIGEWVFTSVCEQYKMWENTELSKIKVAINLSSEQFRRNELIKFIKQTIDETQMNPELLEIEITESVAIRDVEETIEILNDLKALGITVSIDDFGTEYSSLSRLKDLPIDRVKIAMNFIHGIAKDKKDEAIIKVIIYLSKSLGLNVIAEGVETMEQLQFLRHENCDDIQGYYYYKPMPASDIEKIWN